MFVIMTFPLVPTTRAMPAPRLPLLLTAIVSLACGHGRLSAAVIPATDAQVQNGLSPYNWAVQGGSVSSSICGASIALKFSGTRRVSLEVDTSRIVTPVLSRYPIIAWSVNGGVQQIHQLAPRETSVLLASEVEDPVIELYIKGMSPYEDRWSGCPPPNAVTVTGFKVDEGGAAMAVDHPREVWLNIGDSIMSGDAAAHAKGQGRPANDAWADSDDGRASYGYLLAQHYGYRESRIAYGGYNWGGGMAGVPALTTLIDQRSAGVSRLTGEVLLPAPSVVLINLGENGIPADRDVTEALGTLRRRVEPATKIIVMLPLSGRGRAEISRAFEAYKAAARDDNAWLIDLGQIMYGTADGQHPTAAGHRAIFEAALPAFDAILGGGSH